MNKKLLKLMRLTVLIYTIMLSVAGSVRATNVFSQQLSETKVTLTLKKENLEEALKRLAVASKVRFAYDASHLKRFSTTVQNFKGETLDQVLTKLFEHTNLVFKEQGNRIVIFERPMVPLLKSIKVEQPGTISGKISENGATGETLIGVTVKVQQTRQTVISDKDGHYKLSLQPGRYTLVFSYIGYVTQTIQNVVVMPNKETVANVVMYIAPAKLQEAVVLGYSIKTTREMTGSVQTFSAKKLEGVTSNSVISQLKGKIAGMYITEPSGDPTKSASFVVRGQGTLPIVGNPRVSNNLNPLVVVDGVIYSDVINPSEIVSSTDIETISLLKDAASTAIYGSRAGQGVLVITTKKGEAGTSKLSVNSSLGMSKRYTGKIKFMNTQELYDYQRKMLINSFNINNEGLSQDAYLSKYLPANTVLGTDTKWDDLVYRDGITKTLDMSLSGGNEQTRYYFGANTYNEDGALKGNGLQRTSFKLNVDHNITKQLSVSANISTIFDKGNSSPIGGTNSLLVLPWYNPFNADGSNIKILGKDALGNVTPNPIYDLPYNTTINKTQQLLGVFSAKYKVNSWLTLSSNNSYNASNVSYEAYNDRFSIAGESNKGTLVQQKTSSNSFMTSNLLTARKIFGVHTVGGLGGFEFNRSNSEYNIFAVRNLPTGIKVPSAAAEPYNIYNGKSFRGEKFARGFYSLFAEGNYNYDERYFFNSSYRMDYSTNFGIDKRDGHFYSVSGGWLLSNESFLKGNDILTNLKARASYGTSGKVAGEDFLTESFYNFGYQYNSDPAAVINQLGNRDITWEKAYVMNFGLDVDLVKRISLKADIYRKRNVGLLQKVATSALLGVPSQYQNIGQMVNHGLELTLTSQNLVGKFKWQTDFNISFNKNKVEKLYNGSILYGNAGTIKEGDDINSVHAVKWAGVDPQTGKPQFERLEFDSNNNLTGTRIVNSYDDVFAGLSGAAVASQFQAVGNTTPKYFGGLLNTFNYKSFELSVLLNFAADYLVFNNSRASYFSSEGNNILKYNQIKPMDGQVIWEKPGDIATDPMPYRTRKDGAESASSRFWEDGSHIRLRNVRLSYTLPSQWLNVVKIKRASVFISGDNLFVLTRKSFTGVDPEGGIAGNSDNYGISIGYGASRKYLGGLQLTF